MLGCSQLLLLDRFPCEVAKEVLVEGLDFHNFLAK